MQQKIVLKQPMHFEMMKCFFLLVFLLTSSYSLWSQGFIQQTGAANPFNGIDANLVAHPTFGDLDGDGDQDLIVGQTNTYGILYYKNTGTTTSPVYTPAANPIPYTGIDQYVAPDLGDIDGDGDLDAVVGNSDGVLFYFRNTGTPTAPVFTQQNGVENPFGGINFDSYLAPALGDLDGDGDLDLLVTAQLSSGDYAYYENTGAPAAPVYVQRTGHANPFNSSGAGPVSVLGDIDRDGDIDLISGSQNGRLMVRLNVGTATAPLYVNRPDLLSNIYFELSSNGRTFPDLTSPGLADVDGDGDLDLAVGLFFGSVAYLKNVLQITKQPTPGSSSVCPGSSVSTSIQASGDGTFTYQWYRNERSTNTPVSGQTLPKLSLSNVQSSDAGLYCLLVTGAGVSIWSEPFSLTVNPTTQITTQPSNTSACKGSTATFTVTASGTNLIYKWHKGSTSISNNSPTLALNNVQPADAGSYTVDVIGDCGTATSTAATLTVNPITQITSQPQNTLACKGSTAIFTVAASGTNLNYKWYKGNSYIGNNSSILTLNNVQPADAGTYTVDVIGNCGTVTSSTATLTLNLVTAIASQPVAVTKCAGEAIGFSVAATGAGLSFQWKKDGVNITDATSSSYNITAVSAADAADYSVTISGSCGSPVTSDAVALIVNTAVVITAQPIPATKCAGEGVSFSVTATGAGLSYQWKKNGTNISGSTSSTYDIAAVSAADVADYSVTVSGSCGSPVTSDAVALKVNTAPVITAQPVAATKCAGDAISFNVSATGTGLNYQWKKNGADISGAISSTYNIASVSAADAANFSVTISGDCGSSITSNAVALVVNTAPSIITQPTDASVCAGGMAAYSIAVSGTPAPYIQWQFNIDSDGIWINLAGNQSTFHFSGANGYVFKVRAVISNACNTITSNIVGFTQNTVSTPVVNVTNNCGSSTLSTSATGSLLWSTGETASSITVTNAGSYTVTQTVNGCTSAAGSGTSAPKAIPSTPSVTVANNCGSSTLSTNASGSLLWSTNETTPSITVSDASSYNVTQTVNGCTSAAGSGTSAPKAIPSTPSITVVNNCGSSTLSTTATGTLLWSTNETTPSITVSDASSYNVTQTVNGCTSAAGSGTSEPKAIPSTPSITVVNNCGSSTLSTTATGTLLWSTNETTPSITVSNAGSYNVTQTVNGCISAAGSGTAAPKAIPSTPSVTVVNNCGSSTLSTNASGSLLWSNGETASSISVSNAGSYNVTQTVNGCISATGSGTSAPKAIPSTPSVTVVNNCGSSTLSTNASGSLLWSNGETASSISVSNAGSYNVTQTVNGCISATGSGTSALKAIPSTPSITVVNNCGSSILSTTVTGALLWSTGETTASITVVNAGNYSVTQTVNGCTSAAGSGTTVPKTAPSKPVITANGSTNFCQEGSVVLSAPSGFAGYKWSNNATTPYITVTTNGNYSVVVTNAGCSSPASDAITVTVGFDIQKPVIACPAATTLCYTANETYAITTLQATDNCTIASTSYAITGATSRSGSGVNASGIFKPGTSVITWTVKDASGNTSSCKSNVVVNEKFAVTIPDGWALGSGCVLNTVYKGYLPAAYILLTAKPAGGKAPYTYKWSNGSTACFILVNPASATTYTVTVKDARGCTQAASKQISVTDVRCGSKLDKVTICYKGKAICLEGKDVAAYLLKGAFLGSCRNTGQSKGTNNVAEETVALESELTIDAWPNPSTTYFRLAVKSNDLKEKIHVTVMDNLGRVMETKTAHAGETIQLGEKYHAGIYFAEAIQGTKRATIKLIKQGW